MPIGAGSGKARMNIASTGAMKDSGQATAWENHRHSVVPNASLRMRRAACLRDVRAVAQFPRRGDPGEEKGADQDQ